MYLVESHRGGYYISNQSPEIIEAPCETCGDYDEILLTYDKDNKFDAFSVYFSSLKETNNDIIKRYMNGMSKQEIIDSIKYNYDYDRNIIMSLLESGIITNEEKRTLFKKVHIAEKEQFQLLKTINFDQLELSQQPKVIIYKPKRA